MIVSQNIADLDEIKPTLRWALFFSGAGTPYSLFPPSEEGMERQEAPGVLR
jgi:hypothetical protein